MSKSPQLENEFNDYEFDAGSILEEETGEGIDSILGNLSARATASDEAEATASYGIPVGLGFGTRRGIRPLKRVDEAGWWNFSTVDVIEISPELNNRASNLNLVDKKKRSKKKAAKTPRQPKAQTSSAAAGERRKPDGLMLKLNYDDVLNCLVLVAPLLKLISSFLKLTSPPPPRFERALSFFPCFLIWPRLDLVLVERDLASP